MFADEVTLVDEHDQVIGKLDKFEAHRHPAKLHRAISVWMIDENGRVLLQQRSPKKITGGEQWGNTVCGNVWPDESYEDCARRRLKVELGIEGVELVPLTKFHYQSYANAEYSEHEIDQMFLSHVNSAQLQMSLNPDEAIDVLWVDKELFFREIENFLHDYRSKLGRTYPSVEETVRMSTEELRKFTLPAEITINDRQLTVVPWTVLMTQLSILQKSL